MLTTTDNAQETEALLRKPKCRWYYEGGSDWQDDWWLSLIHISEPTRPY